MNELLLNWLKLNLIKRKTINYDYDTSHIRRTFIYDTKTYVSNAEVNDALLQLGYHSSTIPDRELYLHFDISSQSQALIKFRTEVLGPH